MRWSNFFSVVEASWMRCFLCNFRISFCYAIDFVMRLENFFNLALTRQSICTRELGAHLFCFNDDGRELWSSLSLEIPLSKFMWSETNNFHESFQADNLTTSIILLTNDEKLRELFYFLFFFRNPLSGWWIEAYSVGGMKWWEREWNSFHIQRKLKLKLSKNFRRKISQRVSTKCRKKRAFFERDLWTFGIDKVTIYPRLHSLSSDCRPRFSPMENIIKSLNLILNTSNLNRMKIK